ncbi:hypothetical protein QMK19_00420 [Streptomyces sp. H10-C2]|uniref:hypothetical protein n=1 Tax=unclassified Streptomyces TaxID=2593676 RepID=UPI0024B8A7DD|nr:MULTISPECIES: hypothetical protein [unclassified Streptomyces]MDJ0340365.1 hypothetical protein [Streptomyces sp. PH10-H1]MDJ0368187.1 hypothetical protein [Streptomyces sp. H10-C2]
MPATLLAPHAVTLSSAIVAELPDAALVIALYASDYVAEVRPDLAKVAAFMVDGANRWGLSKVVEQTGLLVTFWGHCERDTASLEIWAEHRARFDNYRIIHCSFDPVRLRTIRKHLRAMTVGSVAA